MRVTCVKLRMSRMLQKETQQCLHGKCACQDLLGCSSAIPFSQQPLRFAQILPLDTLLNGYLHGAMLLSPMH
jgi:hypothetical protein